MSISPSDANSSTPSQFARARPSHTSFGHGSAPRPRNPAGNPAASPVGSPTEARHSKSPLAVSPRDQGPDFTSAGGSESSCNMNEWRLDDYGSSSGTPQSGEDCIPGQLTAHKDEPSLIRSEQRRYHARGGKISAGTGYHEMPAGPRNQYGNIALPGGKKSQTVNANHLLNFYYDPIQRSQPRLPPPRKQQKIKPFSRELFLQANYKFVVLDTGNYQIESMDPDKMLQWEDIVCVRFTAPSPVQCPICLESPLCPQITACGHIYCFPCILRYLLMGEDDLKGECWKKCPLCFMKISSKDLYTAIIDYVQQYDVGDCAEFSLLTRPKGSFLPSEKNLHGLDAKSTHDDLVHSFSKFSLTSDVELSVREAKSSLNDWLVRAESGHIDDLERLPYVCASLEHLEKRMKGWVEYHTASGSPIRGSILKPFPKVLPNGIPSSSQLNKQETKTSEKSCCTTISAEKDDLKRVHTLASESILSNGSSAAADCAHISSESYNDYDSHKNDKTFTSSFEENYAEENTYVFYQVADGQQIILHPLNMRCLLHHYNNYDNLPPRVSGKILQLETVTQSETSRRRYRFLSHFPLTTTFQICEIDLRDTLPAEAFVPFSDAIKKREKLRKQMARKEKQEKDQVQDAVSFGMSIPNHLQFFDNGPTFSSDDFQALGNSAVPSTSPPTTERKRFSDVTRLGFAAGCDSPSLGVESAESSNKIEKGVSAITGPSIPTLSFASIITAVPPEIPVEQNIGGFGKKGKKHSKILLSTAGGRRY